MREKHGRNPFPFSLFSHFGTKLPRAQSTKSFHFPNHLLIFASVLQLPFRVSLEKFGTLYFFIYGKMRPRPDLMVLKHPHPYP